LTSFGVLRDQERTAKKKSKFTEAQVAAALRECTSGAPIGQVAHKFGVSEQTLYTWKKKYASGTSAAPTTTAALASAMRPRCASA
jgi:transposase-like protein